MCVVFFLRMYAFFLVRTLLLYQVLIFLRPKFAAVLLLLYIFAYVCIFPRQKFTAVPGIDFSSSEICCCIAPLVLFQLTAPTAEYSICSSFVSGFLVVPDTPPCTP